jgi:predicted DNA-binding protein YlxM (UPF0122 family)
MPKKSLDISEFVKFDAIDEARLRPMATNAEREKSTFDAYYEFLHNASVFTFSISGQLTQTVSRQQASALLNQYIALFDEYAAEFMKFAEINPEQEIKYSSFVDLLKRNQQMFMDAVRKGEIFTPIYSNNANINKAIALHWASGNATANVNSVAPLPDKTVGAVPVSRRSDTTPPVSWMKDTIIPLDRK